MIILLSRDVVTAELLEWSVLRMCHLLCVKTTAIQAKWLRNERGTWNAEFVVDADEARGLEAGDIQEAIRRVWTLEGKPMLEQRLAGIGQRR